MTYQYPQNDLDSAETLLNLLGSFWANTYQDNTLVATLSDVKGQIAQESQRRLLELIASTSRFDIPVFRTEDWYALVLKESEVQNLAIAKYGRTPAVYSNDATLFYGIPTEASGYYANLPEGCVDVPAIFDRLVSPELLWRTGEHYKLEDGQIIFFNSPFSREEFPVRTIFNSAGDVVDREITLWVYRGKWDYKQVYLQFGYALGMFMKSSENYKTCVNLILDSVVDGGTEETQRLLLGLMFGVAVTLKANETVENIYQGDKLVIITDKNVYKFPADATAAVQVGQTLPVGSSLVDYFSIYTVSEGFRPAEAAFEAITIGEGLLAGRNMTGLRFENKLVDLIVEPGIRTKVSWQIPGFSLASSDFWDSVHAEGVRSGKTLAEFLDERADPVGQPEAKDLPPQVNPLHFLFANFLRNNAVIVRVKLKFADNRNLDYIPVAQLRKILPPHVLFVFVVEFIYDDDALDLSDDSYTEQLLGFQSNSVADTLDADTVFEETLKITQIRGRCV